MRPRRESAKSAESARKKIREKDKIVQPQDFKTRQKIFDIVDLPQKRVKWATKFKKLLKNLCMSFFCSTFAAPKVVDNKNRQLWKQH